MGTLEASCLWALVMSFSFGVHPGRFLSAPPPSASHTESNFTHPLLLLLSTQRLLSAACLRSPAAGPLETSWRLTTNSKPLLPLLTATSGTEVNPLSSCPPSSWVFYCSPAIAILPSLSPTSSHSCCPAPTPVLCSLQLVRDPSAL